LSSGTKQCVPNTLSYPCTFTEWTADIALPDYHAIVCLYNVHVTIMLPHKTIEPGSPN